MYLQMVVTTEAFTLFFLAVLISGLSREWVVAGLCVLAVGLITVCRECRLRQERRSEE